LGVAPLLAAAPDIAIAPTMNSRPSAAGNAIFVHVQPIDADCGINLRKGLDNSFARTPTLCMTPPHFNERAASFRSLAPIAPTFSLLFQRRAGAFKMNVSPWNAGAAKWDNE
jgi:hypothetical protein